MEVYKMQKSLARRAVTWLTVAILLLVCGYALCNNLINITMNPIIDEFSLAGANQGMMSSMISLGSLVALFLTPLLQGRVKKFWMLAFSGALEGLMLLLTGASSNFPALLAVCVVLGMGGGLTDSYANSYIIDLHRENSAKCLGLLHGCFGVGGLLTPLLASYVLSYSGWRDVYWVSAGVFGALFLGFVLIGLKTHRRIDVREVSSETKLSGSMLKGYLSRPRNVFLLIAGVFYAASQIGVTGWIARYMTLRFDAEYLGSICLSVYWISATISRFISPMLRIRPLKLYVVGTALAGLAHLAGVWLGTPISMLIAIALIGLLSGHCMPTLLGEAARGNEDKTSLTSSAMLFLMGLSRMGTPLLMGEVGTFVSIVTAMLLPAFAILLSSLFFYFAGHAQSPSLKTGC